MNGKSPTLAIAALIVGLSPLLQAEDPVQFRDPNLKTAVEAVLGVVNPTPSDMNNLNHLDVLSHGITDITGIEYARNLVSLDLRKNRIADISPLAGLTKLTWLGIYGNLITDLTPLSNLVNLREVDPGANQVSDITPLANLTKLTYLDLTDDQIVDISALSGLMNLTRLYLSGNQVVDISPLSGLTNLTTLDVGRNKVTDISVVSGLTNLERLYLHSNQIADIDALTDLTALSTLWLTGNPLNQAAYCTDLAAIYVHDPNMELLYGPNRAVPTAVSATDGTYLDKVEVTWSTVCNGPLYTSRYRVARSDSPSGAKSIISSWQTSTSFDDSTASPGVTYYYWVEAATSEDGAGATGYSVSDTGYVGGTEPPEQTGTITGRVWNDVNGDTDPQNESGLSGWIVYAEANDTANGRRDADEPSAVTDADGTYMLDSLIPGAYVVREVLQAGWEQAYPHGGCHQVQVEAGQTRDHIDFGNRQPTGEPNEPIEPTPHLLWSQPPAEIDPNLDPNAPVTFCGWDEPARSTQSGGRTRQWRMVVDDFHCLGPIPLTRLRWWGSYKAWQSPEPPENQPMAWHIGFWANMVEGLPPDQLYPERLVWSLEIPVERVHFGPVGWDEFPQRVGEMCFAYELGLEPEEWFHPAESGSNAGVYWMSITAVYPPDAPRVNMWGWKTRSHVWRQGALIPAIMGEWPTSEERLFPGRISPVEDSQLCGENQPYDVCFELLTESPWTQWDQPFEPLREWPWSGDAVSVLVEQLGDTNPLIDQEVADDWPCVRSAPIVGIAWYGSYRGYRYDACHCGQLARPRGPDAFLLSVYEDARADAASPYGHPGGKIWEYLAPDYDEVMAGCARSLAGEPNQAVWRYSVRLPEDRWFRPPVADRVYWFSVVAVYTDWPEKASNLWSWTHREHVFGTGANWIDFSPHPSLAPMWRVVQDPLDRPVDMAFTLFTSPRAPGPEPVAYWPLDETEGEVAHDVVGGRHGIVQGGTWTVGVHSSGALGLNGLNDYMDCGDDPALGPEHMTLSLWLRPSHMGGARYVVCRAHRKDDFTDHALLIHLHGQIEFVFDERGSGSGSVISTSQVALEEWVQVAVTRDPDRGTLYINGLEEGSKPYASRSAGEGFRLTVGSHRGETRFFNGRIDDVRLYDVPLTQSQLSELAGL